MASRPRVVLIHSRSELRRKLANGLTRAAFDTFQAETRRDGLPLIYQIRPDLVLLEIVSDQTSTWETFSRLRLFTDTPIILLADQPPAPRYQSLLDQRTLVLAAPVSTTNIVSAAKTFLNQTGSRPLQELQMPEESRTQVDTESPTLQGQLTWMGALFSKSRHILTPEQAVDPVVLNHLLISLKADGVMLYLPSKEPPGWFEHLKSYREGERDKWLQAQSLFLKARVEEAVQAQRVLIIGGPESWEEHQNRVDPREAGLESLIIVPLLGRDRVHGALAVVNKAGSAGKFTPAQVQFVITASESISLAMEMAQSKERASETAILDDVSGAYSAGYLDHIMNLEKRRCERYGRTFSLVRLNWLNFDEARSAEDHVHYARTLRDMVSLARQHVRHSDVLARSTAKEIVFLLPETNSVQAHHLAERLERVLRDGFSDIPLDARPQVAASVMTDGANSRDQENLHPVQAASDVSVGGKESESPREKA